jgi:hypothetical protein
LGGDVVSDTDKDQVFYDIVNAFIALANDKSKEVDRGKVSAAFLYAAARFNIYVVASSASNVEEFMEYEKRAFEYMEGEYKKMLREHFDDYRDNFNDYIKPKTN